MSFNRYVLTQARPMVTLGGFDGGMQSTVISLEGMDTLILDCAYTRASGTALVFAFLGANPNSASGFLLTITDYANKVLTDASFVHTGSTNFNKRFVFSLPAAGVPHENSGNVSCLVSCVAAAAGDTLVITPYVARIG